MHGSKSPLISISIYIFFGEGPGAVCAVLSQQRLCSVDGICE